jgi:uncharacterized coiled-coil protein SlyX
MGWVVQRDWRDDRIAELEAELAAKDARIAEQATRITEQDGRIAELEKRLAQLAEQLGQNSRNSHRPPSSDTPEERRKRKTPEKKARQARKRGGQPGHPGAHRELVSPEKVTKRHCHKSSAGTSRRGRSAHGAAVGARDYLPLRRLRMERGQGPRESAKTRHLVQRGRDVLS